MTEEQKRKKERLNRAFHLANRIEALEHKKTDIKNSCTVKFERDGSSRSGGAYNREEQRIMQILSLDEKIESENQKLKKEVNEIMKIINSLDDVELGNILLYRYIKCMTMEDIAEIMNYDVRTIRRKHLNALDSISI